MRDRVGTERLSSSFGVRVDLDASKPFSPTEQDEVNDLFDEHQLLLFAGHELDLDEQRRTVGYLAPCGSSGVVDSTITYGKAGSGELLFHSDRAYESVPTFGISLYAQKISPDSPRTLFASLQQAYLQLPDGLRARLKGKQGLFLHQHDHANRRYSEQDATDGCVGAVHPVFLEDPRTGNPVLFVSQLATVRILGLELAESDALLEEAFAYLYTQENLYAHRWELDDLLVWNNLVLHHAREPYVSDSPRLLRRVKFGDAGARNFPGSGRTRRERVA